MNAVEIEGAISELARAPFDPVEFPFAFLEAFGNKATTIKRLRSGTTNKPIVVACYNAAIFTSRPAPQAKQRPR